MGNQNHMQTEYSQGRRPMTATRRRTAPITPLQWLSLCLLIGAVILFAERPAWGSGFHIQVNPGGIGRYAGETPLGAVLSNLTNHGNRAGSSGGGGCFISASISEFSGLSLLFGCCLITTLYGLKLLIRSTRSKKDMK